MIFVLEGADGTGKTTLANEIAEVKKTSVLHSYFDISWDIKQHHIDMMNAAIITSRWRPVVVDRWSDSEFVYGTVFRKKPGYDVDDFIKQFLWAFKGTEFIWIYCRHPEAIDNHLKNKELRDEMYESMEEVVKLFDERVETDDKRTWLIYDYSQEDMRKFVKDLPGENFVN